MKEKKEEICKKEQKEERKERKKERTRDPGENKQVVLGYEEGQGVTNCYFC
jgi:hypothetical protein